MASLSIGIATVSSVRTIPRQISRRRISSVWKISRVFSSILKNDTRFRIQLNSNLPFDRWKKSSGNVVFGRRKDPKGLFGPPQTGHIARLEFKRRLERDTEAREAFQKQIREEKERRQTLRQSRVIPDTAAELIEYFLDTEAQEIEFEIARLRQRLNDEFFSQIRLEIGQLRFAVSKTEDMEDRLIELEALQKALEEGIEAYDKMQHELITAKNSLTKILTSSDVKSTLLELVERNEINRSLLALLDENIANAHRGNQKQAAEYMENIRGSVLKYLTV